MKELKKIIEDTFEKKNTNDVYHINLSIIDTLDQIISMLDTGKLRIAEKINGKWITHQWLKKAVLLYIYTKTNKLMKGNNTNYYDKIPLKYTNYDEKKFKYEGVRIVPHATIRKGAFIGKKSILMPSYINIGAYIDEGSMIDTWATVGSCAQIGKNVHISGGVGIGGVIEPLQTAPTIIENNCFIGARSEIVEGVIVEEGSVISMGVYIGQSTKIYDRETGKIHYGIIPKNSVVVSGSLPDKNKQYNLYCAIIVKKVDVKTMRKTEINQLLRNIE
ncbi:2,3,4,5-tetrahydropyridine-2,6-dicarboxylate N-succinyltransferase [Buchnera aphidicola (Formosaphis micheliae)]|uniref:2,3,4,5-tetrahydropyridine-2,6-dicarboxylate N-succinyltransferase n=1 Tax=Buchnera aphidicola TaxID=9 RepID=UPI0031CCBF11